MKVVHINRPKIKQDNDRETLKNILLEKWKERDKTRAQKKYAALYGGPRTDK